MEKPKSLVLLFTIFSLSLYTTVTAAEDIKEVLLHSGDDATLECDLPMEKTSVIMWKDMIFNSGRDPHLLFSSLNPTIVPEKVRLSPDYKTLTFVTMKKNGRVMCEVKTNEEVATKAFDLLVLDSIVDCNGTTEYNEGDDLDNKCDVSTEGTVKLNTFPDVAFEEGHSFDNIEIVLAGKATHELDGLKVECRAQNNSNFKCDWDFSVTYKVRDLRGPDKDTYSVGEVISCSARGNPTPKLEMKVNGKTVIKESGNKIDYKLGDELLEKKHILVDCLADNDIANLRESYNFTITKAKEVSPGELLLENKNWILILIVIIIALVLLLLIIIFLCWRRRKNNQNSQDKENSASLMKADKRKDYANEATA